MPIADYWWWLSFGMVLMVLEIITPGIFFLWIGIGAFITGCVAAVFPAASTTLLGVVFAVLSIISVLIGRKVIGKQQDIPDTGLNNRAAQYIGQIYPVYEAIIDGRGKISVGDTLWQASAKTNIPVNKSVKVIGVNGTILEVTPIDDEP